MAILLEDMVFLMKSTESAEEAEDADVSFQTREVSNTVAAITNSTVLVEAIAADRNLTRREVRWRLEAGSLSLSGRLYIFLGLLAVNESCRAIQEEDRREPHVTLLSLTCCSRERIQCTESANIG